MNAVFKFALISAIVISLGTVINALIPDSFTGTINSNIVSFLVAMKPMDFIIPIDAVFNAIQIFFNFIYGVCTFFLIKWIISIFAQ